MPTAARPTDRPWAGRLRVGAGLLASALLGWLAWQQVRVDATVGGPFGPDRRVDAAVRSPDDADALTRAAGDALRDRPIDGGAFRLLGLAAAAGQDPTRAVDLYRMAVQRGPRDVVARSMLVDTAFAQGRVGEGVAHLDALLRVAPYMRAPLLASLMPAVGNEDLVTNLVKVIAANPPWRGAVAPVLRDSDPAQAETLLARLATRAPLQPNELAVRVEALGKLGRPAQARQIWLASLADEERALDGTPFDGGFEGTDQTGGYGWKWDADPGVVIGLDAIEPAQGQQSLQAEFDGRAVRFVGPRQRLALAPGRYEITSSVEDRTGSPRRFAWFVQCMPGPNLVQLDLPAPSGAGWKRTQATFDVPPDCPGQQLSLRHTGRSMSERQIRGRLRVDDVRLRKVPSSAALPTASRGE